MKRVLPLLLTMLLAMLLNQAQAAVEVGIGCTDSNMAVLQNVPVMQVGSLVDGRCVMQPSDCVGSCPFKSRLSLAITSSINPALQRIFVPIAVASDPNPGFPARIDHPPIF